MPDHSRPWLRVWALFYGKQLENLNKPGEGHDRIYIKGLLRLLFEELIIEGQELKQEVQSEGSSLRLE